MQSIIGKTFTNEDIVFDGNTAYINCTFTNCRFVYIGGDAQLVNCRLEHAQVTFGGEAMKTVQFMQSFGLIPPMQQQPTARPDSGTLH